MRTRGGCGLPGSTPTAGSRSTRATSRAPTPPTAPPRSRPGYAATIYQAQGSTLDSAFVMADPGMDRQDFYVAASRTRGETFFYATPEVGFDRVEFAPVEPPAEALEHIARAAERDGSQAAAHDAALGEQIARLSTPELYARRHEIAAEAYAEASAERERDDLADRVAWARRAVEKAAAREERLGEEPPFWSRGERASWRRESEAVAEAAARAEAAVRAREAELARVAEVGHAARAEQAVIDQAIDGRTAARMAAVRLDPPRYTTAELGERPTDPTRREAWESAARGIETWRMEHGVGTETPLWATSARRARTVDRASWPSRRSAVPAANSGWSRSARGNGRSRWGRSCERPQRRSSRATSGAPMSAIGLDIGDELVERIAHRAAELIAQRAGAPREDGWLRGADKIAAYIDAPRSRVYALASARRIPVHHDGSALIARRSELDQWLLRGGGRRP